MRPLTDLAPDPSNPRTITPEAAAGLRYSLDRYGDLSFVFDAGAGLLVCGHQRVEQLRALGVEGWEVERECGEGFTGPDGEGREGDAWIVHPRTGARWHLRLVRWTPETRREAYERGWADGYRSARAGAAEDAP